jgi:hypothetical protein
MTVFYYFTAPGAIILLTALALAPSKLRTPLLRMPPLLSDMLRGLLSSGGPNIVDGELGSIAVETCLPTVA